MSGRGGKRKKRPGPRFPRKQWRPGQVEKSVPPKKGKGSSYDRPREARRARRQADEEAG